MNKICLCFFKNKDYVFTSYKVGYSSFKTLHKKKFLQHITDLTYINQNILTDTSNNFYGIHRCPKLRLESLYKDKMLYAVNPNLIQICQKVIIDYFSYDQFIKKNITFEDFILNLPHYIEKDHHYYPQNNCIPESITNYIQLNKIYLFSKIFEVKIPVENTTNKKPLYWSQEMQDIVYSLYKADYERFGYEP